MADYLYQYKKSVLRYLEFYVKKFINCKIARLAFSAFSAIFA